MISSLRMRWLGMLLVSPLAAWAAEEGPGQPAVPPQQTVQQTVQSPQDIETRVGKLEAVLQNEAVLNLLKEVQTLKAEISRLRGVTDMQTHTLESLSKRQSDLYLDLDKRLEELNKQAKSVQPAPQPVAAVAVSAPAPAAQAPAASPAPKEDPLAESKAYETALNLFRAGEYEKAIAGFGDFLKTYPDSTLAANAQYWTGYSYYARKDYKNALSHQLKLVSAYPQSAKVPDALLNIASNQVELNDLSSAKKNLKEIVEKYPGTNAAAIAAKRLNLLK